MSDRRWYAAKLEWEREVEATAADLLENGFARDPGQAYKRAVDIVTERRRNSKPEAEPAGAAGDSE